MENFHYDHRRARSAEDHNAFGFARQRSDQDIWSPDPRRSHLRLGFALGARYDNADIPWYVAIHLTFIFSGVAVATMDWIEEKAHQMERNH